MHDVLMGEHTTKDTIDRFPRSHTTYYYHRSNYRLHMPAAHLMRLLNANDKVFLSATSTSNLKTKQRKKRFEVPSEDRSHFVCGDNVPRKTPWVEY